MARFPAGSGLPPRCPMETSGVPVLSDAAPIFPLRVSSDRRIGELFVPLATGFSFPHLAPMLSTWEALIHETKSAGDRAHP